VVDRLSLGATVMNGKAGFPQSTAKPTVLDQQLGVIVDQALAQVSSALCTGWLCVGTHTSTQAKSYPHGDSCLTLRFA
jgi:hypothetical protein